MKKYKLGNITFYWDSSEQKYIGYSDDGNRISLKEKHFAELGATPLDEPEEEFAVFDDPYLPEKGSILGKLIRNQQKLIQAVKQLQEER